MLGLLILPLLQSCGGGDGACSIRNQNRQVHEALLKDYLWYREVPEEVNYADFDSPAELLDFLRNDPPDRFSYITDAEEYKALFNDGQYAGFGFSFEISADDELLVRFVYENSPAWLAGMRRGDEILMVNGETAADLIAANDWDTAFGDSDVGVVGELRLKKPDGSEVDIVMAKAVIDINTVLHAEVIDTAVARIGYLVFNGFLDTSYGELQAVFAGFKSAGVSKVILDLRYNGGGAVWVADALASWLYGNNNREVFTELRFNDLNSELNYSYNLVPLNEGIVIDELIVITTASTCSASEMLINGLKPFLRVRTVGSATCGKPVGMSPEEICDKMLVAVNFAAYNANGEGDYFDGLAADCPATDNVRIPFGDAADPMLSEALYLSANNRCSSAQRGLAPVPSRSPVDAASLRAVIGAW